MSGNGPARVVAWIAYGSDRRESCGGLGGFFNRDQKGMRWGGYLAAQPEEQRPYLEALRASVLERRLRHGGDWHQTARDGVPLFQDDTIGVFTYRAWGDLLAAVWSEAEDRDYCYMDFYMCSCSDCGCKG